MRELYIALKSLYDATSAATFKATWDVTAAQCLAAAVALRAYSVGGFYLASAPHGTALPHITVSPAADTSSGTMGIRYVEGTVVTFTIWCPRYGLDAGLSALANLKRVFDNQLVAFSSGGMILCVRRTSGRWVEQGEPEGGFAIVCDYEYKYK